MRRILVVGLVTLFAALPALGGGASPGSTPPVPAPAIFLQHLTGVAFGTTGTRLAAPGAQTDIGQYTTTGQLGHGSYRFDQTLPFPGCILGVGTVATNGTARLVRSDGAVLTGTTKVTEVCFDATDVPAVVTVKVTHGSRDLVGAQLEFRGTMSFLATPSGTTGPEAFAITGTVSVRPRVGYWMLDATGKVFAFGGVNGLGNAPTPSAVHIEPTPSRAGYWIVDASGRVFAFGDARSFGSADPAALAAGESVTSMSATPSGAGYWLFTDRGRVLPFGNAKFLGDMHAVSLNGGVVGSAATTTGNGYYLVARDGGVFTFGDARFRGSMGATHLNQPVIGLVSTSDNQGYWLVASDGGVFTFNAPFLGSMGRVPLTRPVIGMVRYGTGYLLVGQDGGIFDFSPALFFGSLGGSPVANPIVGAAAAG